MSKTTDQANQSKQKMFLVLQKIQQSNSFDRILESKQTCPEPGTHCKKGMSDLQSMPIPCSHDLFAQTLYFFFNSLVPLLRQGQQITSLRWLDALKETKNQSWPLPLSTPVFSWVEEAADVGKQGCNTQHGDANDVGVGTHVAKRALTAASRLHLHGWGAQRLLQRSASCSRTGSGAHETEHRGAGQSQEHASEQTRAGASHVVSFGTKRATKERLSKSSSSSQKHCGVR